MTNNIKDIAETIKELCEDNSVPRNIKAKFEEIINSLSGSQSDPIKINKALHDLDEINEDINLQPYVRTQIWNISSMLEKVVKKD